ncbi:MAG: c-type cytochrome, partial [Planctomyces sp.]
YGAHCVACHGTMGEGGVGPNFTDNYWIHGGDIKSIFKTIKYGVPEKGMISWQAQLNPSDRRLHGAGSGQRRQILSAMS